MLRNFKLSIAQLLCLTAIAGAVFFLATYDREEPIWREDVLAYSRPDVPENSALVTSNSISVDYGPIAHDDSHDNGTTEYTSSSELILQNHRSGWNRIRLLFYGGKEWLADSESYDFYDEYDYSKLNFRSGEDLLQLAQWEGRERCRQQLHQLLQRHGEQELRSKIAYPRYWVAVLPLLILVVAILVLAICCPLDWRAVRKI